jgi:hypothetical protein
MLDPEVKLSHCRRLAKKLPLNHRMSIADDR